MDERRNLKRKNFSYYMRVVDDTTQQLVGHLADISPKGFKLDCAEKIPAEKEFRLRMDLTADVSNKPAISFSARAHWCKKDDMDPFVFNVGFEITNISPIDGEIFRHIVEKYGAPDSLW